MISHKHQCIFIHIPKCAGTSIENLLGHFDGHEGREGQDHRSVRMLQPGLSSASLGNLDNIKDLLRRTRDNLRSHANPNNGLKLTKQQYQDYYKFTFVRNPWARAHSWYKNAMRDAIHQANYGIPADMPFAEFIEKFAGKGMLRPQTYWLKDFDGRIPMDFVGKFETLKEDFEVVRTALNLQQATLPHKIAGEKSDYRNAYDDDTAERVARVYQEEIRLFDYRFDDPAKGTGKAQPPTSPELLVSTH